METRVKTLRTETRDLVKEYNKTEDDLKALQVGFILVPWYIVTPEASHPTARPLLSTLPSPPPKHTRPCANWMQSSLARSSLPLAKPCRYSRRRRRGPSCDSAPFPVTSSLPPVMNRAERGTNNRRRAEAAGR